MQNYVRLIVLLFILFASNSVCSQEHTVELTGRVQSLKNDVSNILVVNLNSKKSTITNKLGVFTMEVKLRDTIRFAAVQYLTKEIIMTDAILSQKSIHVVLVENVIKLSEVTVTPYNLTGNIGSDVNSLHLEPVVNASSLGLPNADIEVMTQSERLLIEADRGEFVTPKIEFDTITYEPSVSITINTHKIMNAISGRTKALKNRVALDENLELENEIVTMFSKKAMSEEFGIPESNIDGFLTFCIYQTDFSQLSAATNTMEIWEYLKTKSAAYKETDYIKDEPLLKK